jgi:hypothetical protein
MDVLAIGPYYLASEVNPKLSRQAAEAARQ